MLEKDPGRRAAPATSSAEPRLEDGAAWGLTSPMARETLGLAFAVTDLVRTRDWAAHRGLSLTIQLDHAANGIRFEEVLSLIPRGQSLRCAAIWRSGNGVVLQRTGERARSHHTLDEALASWARLERRSRLGFWRRG